MSWAQQVLFSLGQCVTGVSLEGGSLGGEIVQGTIKIHVPPPAVLICFHEIDHSSLSQFYEEDNHLTGCLETLRCGEEK